MLSYINENGKKKDQKKGGHLITHSKERGIGVEITK